MSFGLAAREVIRPLLLLAAFGVALVAAAPADATFPGANGKIAFTCGGHRICTVNPDGSAETPITSPPTAFHEDHRPAWSPSGDKIAFSRLFSDGDTENEAIYTVNADGSGLTLVPTGIPFSSDPTWSPDGAKIAFTGGGGFPRVYTMNADGSGVTQLLGMEASQPAWSPDGSKIALEASGLGGRSDIYVVNPDGSGLANVSNDARFNQWPSWSPDGAKIAYYGQEPTCNPGCGSAIRVLNADGSGQQKIRDGGDEPAWSPDGRKLAFLYIGIWTINADGSGGNQVASDTHSDFVNPDWQRLPTVPYPHPASASPIRVSIVPAFKQCGTPVNVANGQHAPPLSTPSCQPPVPGNEIARVGPAYAGWFQFAVAPGDTDATNGNQADVLVTASFSDMATETGGDYDPNPTGADITAITRFRITDKRNNYGGASGTATEVDFAVPINCSSTPGPDGSNCSVATLVNSLVPGYVEEQRQTVVQAFRVRVEDSGANGVRGDSDDRIMATQGVYIP